jgi:adenosylcobinamide kinase/adenosylcobinamide-phosphate guanylyltransferase
MIILITGGSGSGKSAFAEQLLWDLPDVETKLYIATMQVQDKEDENRVLRHRALRATRNFFTLEQPVQVGECFMKEQGNPGKFGALLECMSNLVANEMFAEAGMKYPFEGDTEENHIDLVQSFAEKLVAEVVCLSEQVKHLIIVTNNVFEDGILYDRYTATYLQILGLVNQKLAALASQVYEVVVGIPLLLKTEESK